MALILARSEVEAALPMSECIASQEEAFREHALGTAKVPARIALEISEHGGFYIAMPAHLSQTSLGDEEPAGAMATKVVTFHPDNPMRYNLSPVGATVLLHNPKNGELLAIMDGTAITALRTAAGSAVATKYLAREESSILGILGSGVQAESHLVAMCQVRLITEARVYSRDQGRRESFARRMTDELGMAVVPVSSARDAVEGIDIVVTATTAREPIVDGKWFAEGAHINCVGSGLPDRRELDDTTVLRSKVVVDTRESALEEAGDLLIPMAKGLITEEWIHAELGDIVAGKAPGRTSEGEITLFKSVGVALQDVAAAARAYKQARSLGIGHNINL
jgi:alanine dehydrogenase